MLVYELKYGGAELLDSTNHVRQVNLGNHADQ